MLVSRIYFNIKTTQATKSYKQENIKLKQLNDQYAKKIGVLTVEKDWLVEKLVSLDLSVKQHMLKSGLNTTTLSISKQAQLLNISRNQLYYQVKCNPNTKAIKDQILKVFTDVPIYGKNKVHQQLLKDGFKVSLNTIAKYTDSN